MNTKITASRLRKFVGTYELSTGKKFDVKLQNGIWTINGDAPGVSDALTFPEKLDADAAVEYENITARVSDGLSKQNLQPLFDVLKRDTKLEEEQIFGRDRWKFWNEEHGAYLGSKVIGAR